VHAGLPQPSHVCNDLEQSGRTTTLRSRWPLGFLPRETMIICSKAMPFASRRDRHRHCGRRDADGRSHRRSAPA